MIVLQSIRVRNFRAIKEAVFQPSENGITGIFGPNGAGKTTFLAATLFALYGVKPPGAGQASLRRIGSKGESSVSVVFQHLGQQVEIIRELKSANNRVVVNIYVDGVPQTVTSVTAAEQWVKSRLGIDANGFMTAFVVRQKELDQLIQAKPAERKQIIEKLAGIDAINMALKSAREDENSVKKSLNTMSGSEEEVSRLAEILNASANRVSDLTKEIAEIESNLNPLNKKVEDLKTSANKIAAFSNKISALIAKKESSEEEKTVTLEQLNQTPEIYEDELTIEELRSQYASLKEEVKTQTEKLTEQKAQLMSAENAFETTTTKKNKIEEDIKAIAKSFTADTDYGKAMAEQSEVVQNIENSIYNLSSKIEETEESIKTLSHSENCPTCLQALPNPQIIIDNLRGTITQLEEQKTASAEELEEAKTLYNKTVVEYSFKQKNDSLHEQLAEIGETVSEETITELKANINETETLMSDLQEKLNDVEERGIKLKEAKTTEETKQKLETKIVTLEAKILSLDNEIASLTEQIGGVEKFKETQNITKLEQDLIYKKTELSEKQTEIAVAKQKHGTDKTAYDSAKEAWDKKKTLMDKQGALTLTSDLINKFRLDTISALAPELSETATSLISDMTNGDFTEIRLDEEFNAYLTDSQGIERPSTWLSGGEESAVALALRISIAFLITGGNPSLLWLDEVLTAQDADRRNTMLTMIRQLPIQQIIMINHTHEAADIVDKTVEIVPNISEGSTIKETENFSADTISE